MNDIPLYRYATFSLYSKYPRYEPSSFELWDIQMCIHMPSRGSSCVCSTLSYACICYEGCLYVPYCTVLCRVQWFSIFISKPRMSRSQQKSSGGVADTAEKRLTVQEMAKGFSFFEEALLLFEAQDLTIEWYTKVAAAIPNATQCSCVICDEKKKKKATTQTSLDCFFNRVDRIESSKESEPVPLTAVWVMLLLALHLLLPITFSSTISHCLSLLQSVVPPVCSREPAPVCYLLYCATALFNVPYCKIKNVFFLFSIF